MPRLPGRPDLSRLVEGPNPKKIYDRIRLIIGDEIIEVSGAVLCLNSPVFEEGVKDLGERYIHLYRQQYHKDPEPGGYFDLSIFKGSEDEVRDCVVMMYGGEINIKNENIQTVALFSAMFRIEDMFAAMVDWVKEHMSYELLSSIIQVGHFVNLSLRKTDWKSKSDILHEMCRKFIIDTLQDDLLELSHLWSDLGLLDSPNTLRFLVHEDIIFFTLPVLTSVVSRDPKNTKGYIKLILKEFAEKELSDQLAQHGSRIDVLLLQMIQVTDKILEVSSMKEDLQQLKSDISAARNPLKLKLNFSNTEKLNTPIFIFGKDSKSEEAATESNKPTKGEISILEACKRFPNLNLMENVCPNTEKPEEKSEESHNGDLKSLFLLDFRKFSAKRALGMKEEFNLEHYEFIDIAMNWLDENRQHHDVLLKFLTKFQEVNSNYAFLHKVRDSMTFLDKYCSLCYSLPEVPESLKENGEYHIACLGMWGRAFMIESPFKDADGDNIDSELIKFEDATQTSKCKGCDGSLAFNLRLDVNSPYHIGLEENSHCRVKHWFVMTTDTNSGTITQEYYSVFTDKWENMIEKLQICNPLEVELFCLYECKVQLGDDVKTEQEKDEKNFSVETSIDCVRPDEDWYAYTGYEDTDPDLEFALLSAQYRAEYGKERLDKLLSGEDKPKGPKVSQNCAFNLNK